MNGTSTTVQYANVRTHSLAQVSLNSRASRRSASGRGPSPGGACAPSSRGVQSASKYRNWRSPMRSGSGRGNASPEVRRKAS